MVSARPFHTCHGFPTRHAITSLDIYPATVDPRPARWPVALVCWGLTAAPASSSSSSDDAAATTVTNRALPRPPLLGASLFCSASSSPSSPVPGDLTPRCRMRSITYCIYIIYIYIIHPSHLVIDAAVQDEVEGAHHVVHVHVAPQRLPGPVHARLLAPQQAQDELGQHLPSCDTIYT
jgi:hypothetical protein